MADSIRREINTALVPVFYRTFHCLMSGCQDTCCSGDWQIAFNKKDYLKLRRLNAPEPLKGKLEQTVRRLRGEKPFEEIYAEFHLENGSCPLHSPEGLCSLQLSCGEDALPRVCKLFPRRAFYTPVAREYSMSPACEGVLEQLWDLPGGVEFVEEELLPQDQKQMTIQQDGQNLLCCFQEVRSLCIDILQNRNLPLSKRMVLLGIALQELHDMDWTDPNIQAWLDRTAGRLESPAIVELLDGLPENRRIFLSQNIKTALKINKTGDYVWPIKLLHELGLELSPGGVDSTKIELDLSLWRRDLEAFRDGIGDVTYFFENLMVAVVLYLLFPAVSSKEELWKGYVSLCNLYSFYRFVAVAGCHRDPSRARLFHLLVMVNRALLHSIERQVLIRDEFFQHNSATLAHMAILAAG